MHSRVRGHPISFPQPHGMQTWRPRPILVNSVGLTQLTRPPCVGSLSIMQLRNLAQNLEFFSTAQQLFSGTPDPPIQFCGPNPMMSQQPISAAPPLGGHNCSGQLAHQGLNSPAPPLLRPPPTFSTPRAVAIAAPAGAISGPCDFPCFASFKREGLFRQQL